jgi:hypothetical protein
MRSSVQALERLVLGKRELFLLVLTKKGASSSLLSGTHPILHLLHRIVMGGRSLSLSTFSGTESEADDECLANLAYDSDEDGMDLTTELSDESSTSFEHEQPSTHGPDALEQVFSKLESLYPRTDVPRQPPHPQHLPSPLEIVQTEALIRDREAEMLKLDAELDELLQNMVSVRKKRDAAAEAARNHRSFIAGKSILRVPLSSGGLIYFLRGQKDPNGRSSGDISFLSCIWTILFPMDVDRRVKILSRHGFQHTSIMEPHYNH